MRIYTLHHCDEWCTWNSMEMADEYFQDSEEGRKKLLERITEEIESGAVELIGDIGFLNLDISCGNIQNANERLKYAYINTMESAA